MVIKVKIIEVVRLVAVVVVVVGTVVDCLILLRARSIVHFCGLYQHTRDVCWELVGQPLEIIFLVQLNQKKPVNLFLKHESSNKEEQNRHSEIRETSRIGGCSIINRYDFFYQKKKKKSRYDFMCLF